MTILRIETNMFQLCSNWFTSVCFSFWKGNLSKNNLLKSSDCLLSVNLSTCPLAHLFSAHMKICLFVKLFICLNAHMSVFLSVCPFPICPFDQQSICPSVHLPTCPPTHLKICPFVKLFISLNAHMSVCLPLCPYVCKAQTAFCNKTAYLKVENTSKLD
jgi:hypothetical protein